MRLFSSVSVHWLKQDVFKDGGAGGLAVGAPKSGHGHHSGGFLPGW